MFSRKILLIIILFNIVTFFYTCDIGFDSLLYDDDNNPNSEDFKETIANALAANCETREDLEDYIGTNVQAIPIQFNGNTINVNGAGAVVKGGTVLVNGPAFNSNGALDWDVSFKMNGGFMVAAGSS